MAALSAADRILVGAKFQEERSLARDVFGSLGKSDIQAATAAIDDWIVANSASFNAAIPLPARTALTQTQKILLFVHVLLKRSETGA